MESLTSNASDFLTGCPSVPRAPLAGGGSECVRPVARRGGVLLSLQHLQQTVEEKESAASGRHHCTSAAAYLWFFPAFCSPPWPLFVVCSYPPARRPHGNSFVCSVDTVFNHPVLRCSGRMHGDGDADKHKHKATHTHTHTHTFHIPPPANLPVPSP